MRVHPSRESLMFIDFFVEFPCSLFQFFETGTDIPLDSARRLIELRERVELKDLAELTDKDVKQLPRLRFLLGSDQARGSNQPLIAFDNRIARHGVRQCMYPTLHSLGCWPRCRDSSRGSGIW